MGNRQRKGGEKEGLSEACVRGMPCMCQFHSPSSMLRSFSPPQRENTPTGPDTEKTGVKEQTEIKASREEGSKTKADEDIC